MSSAPQDDLRPMLIGGQWTSAGATVFDSINPATGERNYRIAGAGPEHVELAVAAAREAQAQPAWRDMLPHRRAALLMRIADGMEANADRFADAQRLENGKVVAECRSQVASAAATFRYYAAVCETLGEEITPSRGAYLSMSIHEPHGVVAAITPWNSPLTMEAQKVAPALAAGNAVILKPSEVTPSPALELGRIALEAGLYYVMSQCSDAAPVFRGSAVPVFTGMVMSASGGIPNDCTCGRIVYLNYAVPWPADMTGFAHGTGPSQVQFLPAWFTIGFGLL